MTRGAAAPEVEHAYTQARALCQQVGETPELFPVLLGLWRFYIGRLQLHTAQELGEMLLRLAQRTQDPALSVTAHSALVRPNQQLAVDTFLGLKKSKLFFRTRVALHFQ